mmetsp:Transcript_18778/g.54267  ORF Transcript_18778/g.54267 Transcript_18778/m.54267 type:complete len:324 (+) Transcript_18778:1048-2019(+)
MARGRPPRHARGPRRGADPTHPPSVPLLREHRRRGPRAGERRSYIGQPPRLATESSRRLGEGERRGDEAIGSISAAQGGVLRLRAVQVSVGSVQGRYRRGVGRLRRGREKRRRGGRRRLVPPSTLRVSQLRRRGSLPSQQSSDSIPQFSTGPPSGNSRLGPPRTGAPIEGGGPDRRSGRRGPSGGGGGDHGSVLPRVRRIFDPQERVSRLSDSRAGESRPSEGGRYRRVQSERGGRGAYIDAGTGSPDRGQDRAEHRSVHLRTRGGQDRPRHGAVRGSAEERRSEASHTRGRQLFVVGRSRYGQESVSQVRRTYGAEGGVLDR